MIISRINRSLLAILCIFALQGNPSVAQTISRIEPPNWWIGMKEPVVQLLLYGKEIGTYTAHSKYKGVKVLHTSCPGNNNYLFIDLHIASSARPGDVPVILTSAGKQDLNFSYPIYARKPNSSQRIGYTSKDVIYLITPDRFANGDVTNDDIAGLRESADRSAKDGRHGGDIKGIQDHLQYIADLGATALWINPVLENDMPKRSYHGYAITDFYKVDPRMGSNASFKELTTQASTMGVKMVMDMIHNHCGLHHWWMKDLPSADWINYPDTGYVETNHQKTLHPDPYASGTDIEILENGWFVPTMPDLNVDNPYLANYLINNSLWWIEYAGLSGIRMDTYLYPESSYMSRWSKRVMDEYPNFTITGEVWFDQPDFVSYWQEGKVNADGYVSHLNSLFDFPLNHALIKALNQPEAWNSGWLSLYEMLAKDFQYPDPNHLVTFVDNHDMSRIMAQLDGDIAKIKMALAFVMTMRGIPQLYYGTEILMNSPKTRDDGLVRGDFTGGWPGDEINAFTGEGLNADQKEMKAFVTRLLNWRKTAVVVHEGKTMHYVPEQGVYVIFRYTDNEKLMVILNKRDEATLSTSRFVEMIGSCTSATDIMTGNTVSLKDSIALKGPGPLILSFQ